MLEVEPTSQRGRRLAETARKLPAPLQKHSPGGHHRYASSNWHWQGGAYRFAARYLFIVAWKSFAAFRNFLALNFAFNVREALLTVSLRQFHGANTSGRDDMAVQLVHVSLRH